MSAQRLPEAPMKQGNYEHRITRVEMAIEMISQTLIELKSDMNNRFGKVDNNFDKIESKFDKLEAKIELMRKEGWSQMRWIFALILALAASPLFSHIMKILHLGQ